MNWEFVTVRESLKLWLNFQSFWRDACLPIVRSLLCKQNPNWQNSHLNWVNLKKDYNNIIPHTWLLTWGLSIKTIKKNRCNLTSFYAELYKEKVELIALNKLYLKETGKFLNKKLIQCSCQLSPIISRMYQK